VDLSEVIQSAEIALRNDLETIGSLPFMVAAVLCDGHVDSTILRLASLGRADIVALAARSGRRRKLVQWQKV
jgi:hypothetical protein